MFYALEKEDMLELRGTVFYQGINFVNAVVQTFSVLIDILTAYFVNY